MENVVQHLILASQSPVRRQMLIEAGLVFDVIPSPFDEEAHKEEIAHLPPRQQAAFLASGKAQAVSQLYPQALVIGADQICAHGSRIYGKPGTYAQAVEHLNQLQGNTHYQYSAACIYRQGQKCWEEVEVVSLSMKPLTSAEIIRYIQTDEPFQACGAYCYEKSGHNLFSHIEGSAAAIKGLPLNGLMNYLTQAGL